MSHFTTRGAGQELQYVVGQHAGDIRVVIAAAGKDLHQALQIGDGFELPGGLLGAEPAVQIAAHRCMV